MIVKQISEMFLTLLCLGDLVATTSAVPVMLGLQTKDALRGFLPAPTEFGAVSGCIAGVVSVIVNGYINHANNDNPFEYFWLKNGGICSLCGVKTMWTFIITPIVSGIITYLFSFLDIKIRGERARQPILRIAFDTKLRGTLVDEEWSSASATKDADKDNAVKVSEGDVVNECDDKDKDEAKEQGDVLYLSKPILERT